MIVASDDSSLCGGNGARAVVGKLRSFASAFLPLLFLAGSGPEGFVVVAAVVAFGWEELGGGGDLASGRAAAAG
jgi:hypothetical protein